jgi:ribonuclease BN (tRNA processing enzyme)
MAMKIFTFIDCGSKGSKSMVKTLEHLEQDLPVMAGMIKASHLVSTHIHEDHIKGLTLKISEDSDHLSGYAVMDRLTLNKPYYAPT